MKNYSQLITVSIVFGLLLIFTPQSGKAQNSLYEDYKANKIGDVITIELQENISGSSNTNYENQSETSGEAQGGLSGNVSPFLPLFGANASVDYQTDDRNQSKQSQLLRGTLSARIVETTPSGDLLIEGKRITDINGERHKITVKGYVRPNDLDAQNRVPSYRIANAEIIYEKQNSLKQASKRPGFIKRLAWVALGVGLGTVAIIKAF